MKILNVTPSEFRELWIGADPAIWRYGGLPFEDSLIELWGLVPFETYRVVVRKDVPHIPYHIHSFHVDRVEVTP